MAKVVRKHVVVQEFEVIDTRLIKSKYNKFVLWLAKVFNWDLKDNLQYVFRVRYTGGTRLQINDVVINKQGVIMVVVREANRIAMLVTRDSFSEKPNLYGKLTIIIDEKEKNKLKKMLLELLQGLVGNLVV